MKVFAFAHHAPDTIVMKLGDSGVERSDIYIVGIGEKLPRKNKSNHLIFLNTDTFQLNRTALETKDVQSYVFDNILKLAQFNFTPADFKAEEYFHVDGFALIPCIKLAKCQDKPINKKRFDIVDVATVIAKQQITFLNQFMTFVYQTPKETHQGPIKELVCRWMASRESFAKYCKRLETLRESVSLTDKQVKRLQDIMSSKIVTLYRDALQQEGDEDDIAKEYSISAYEMRYIRAINKAAKKRETK